jgi:2-hydroxycyclohexanecarboxyl-CoA dehydrogenase
MAFRGLQGQVALVTGGGSGIGRAISLRLAEEGCRLAVFDLNAAGAEESVRLAADAGGTAAAYPVDITDHAAVMAAVERVENEVGGIGILVNNAGWDRMMNFVDTDPAFWRKVIDINLVGHLNLHHAVLPHMAARRSGRIINIASDAGRVGSSGEAVYSACKGGMIAFAKTIAREHARHGIRVNTICPGPTDTPLLASFADDMPGVAKLVERLQQAIPLRRLGQPEDYPGLVAFLASSDADYITGQTISVSGGLSMGG